MKTNRLLITSVLLSAWIYSANAQVTLNLKFFIEGLYRGTGTTITDNAVVELHDPVNTNLVVETFTGAFLANGTMACTYTNSVLGNPYYIVIRHRSSIQTWSAAPVTMSSTTSYDFSISPSSAYGNNQSQVDVGPARWALYSGDINQDGNIDLFDFIIFDFGVSHGLFGYYPADLNGDGNVDLLDFPILSTNMMLGIFVRRP